MRLGLGRGYAVTSAQAGGRGQGTLEDRVLAPESQTGESGLQPVLSFSPPPQKETEAGPCPDLGAHRLLSGCVGGQFPGGLDVEDQEAE